MFYCNCNKKPFLSQLFIAIAIKNRFYLRNYRNQRNNNKWILRSPGTPGKDCWPCLCVRTDAKEKKEKKGGKKKREKMEKNKKRKGTYFFSKKKCFSLTCFSFFFTIFLSSSFKSSFFNSLVLKLLYKKKAPCLFLTPLKKTPFFLSSSF